MASEYRRKVAAVEVGTAAVAPVSWTAGNFTAGTKPNPCQHFIPGSNSTPQQASATPLPPTYRVFQCQSMRLDCGLHGQKRTCYRLPGLIPRLAMSWIRPVSWFVCIDCHIREAPRLSMHDPFKTYASTASNSCQHSEGLRPHRWPDLHARWIIAESQLRPHANTLMASDAAVCMYHVFPQDHFIPGRTITQIQEVRGYSACVGVLHTARSSPEARCERRRRKQPHLHLNGSGWRQNCVGEFLAGGLFPEGLPSNTSGVKPLRVPRRGRASEPRNEGRRPEVTSALSILLHWEGCHVFHLFI